MDLHDSGCSCVFAVIDACQRAIGRVYVERPDAIAILSHEFGTLPAPASFGDAIDTASALERFLPELGHQWHQTSRFCGEPDRCGFSEDVSGLDLRPSAETYHDWSAARTMQAWARAYDVAFAAAHPACRVASVKESMRRRGGHRVGLAALARQAACSAATFRREFRARGCLPDEYRILQGVVIAIGLLLTTSWKNEVIALRAGWRSKKNLYRALRQLVGLTPGEIRALPSPEATRLLSRLRARLAAHT